MTIDCRNTVKEIANLISSNLVQLGVSPNRVQDAVEHAARRIYRIEVSPKQMNDFGRLIARLVAYRLARVNNESVMAKKHLDRHMSIRWRLLSKGFSEEVINDLCAVVTRLVVA